MAGAMVLFISECTKDPNPAYANLSEYPEQSKKKKKEETRNENASAMQNLPRSEPKNPIAMPPLSSLQTLNPTHDLTAV